MFKLICTRRNHSNIYHIEEGYFLHQQGNAIDDYIKRYFDNQSHYAEGYIYICYTQSEQVLRRLQRRVAERIIDWQEVEVWYEYEDGRMENQRITHYGQLSVRENNENYFWGTISDDLDAMTDAALSIRIKELEEKNG